MILILRTTAPSHPSTFRRAEIAGLFLLDMPQGADSLHVQSAASLMRCGDGGALLRGPRVQNETGDKVENTLNKSEIYRIRH